ncbi:MAG TPA: single-stranded-DNA-specific exonuclease RecJ [Dongiaceae bacterium]|nr:single-stranded-DNA-specific exonuclease RecJ [Dongiaceae bacterium]
MTDAVPYLGIARSLCGRFWLERPGDERLGLAIAQRCQVPELIGRMLAARGQSPESAPGFLEPRLRDLLTDPSELKDMDRAAERLADAVAAGERIAVFGDYDVDGATSAALLSRFLRAIGAQEPLLYVPDRMREGYGPNAPAFHVLKGEGASLVITVDCGITAFAALDEAARIGLDVIVADHHVAEPALPVAFAVVNPNRLDESFPHRNLAAVGVVYLLVIAANRALRRRGWFCAARPEPDLLQWLDLVALGTVCDVVALTGLNRALAAQGLKVMGRRGNLGLKTLCDVARVTERVEAYHAGFLLGPRVNAGGRVGRSDLGARLLSTEESTVAGELARQLDAYNDERRALEAQVQEAAIRQADAQAADNPHLLFLTGTDWHPGVIGIVAGRLKERYQRPVCVISLEDGVGKASGRSVAGLHLGQAVIAAREAGLVLKGGGHAMAAGFEAREDTLGALHAFIAARFKDDLDGTPLMPTLLIDGALQARAASPDLISSLERLAPFGAGNAEPRFVFPAQRAMAADVVGTHHVRCVLSGADGGRLKAIAFRAAGEPLGRALLASRGAALHVAGRLKLDNWQGRAQVQLQIEDAAFLTG